VRLARFPAATLFVTALVAAGVRSWVPRPWLETNDVTTGRHPGYPDLQDRSYPLPPQAVLAAAAAAARRIPRWHVVSTDTARKTVHVTVRTAIGGFTDDLTVHVVPDGADGSCSRVSIRSRSRVGRGDFGENARHIRALQAAMDAHLPRPASVP
jgi:uncharacterized protein (DUF1499 family)